MKLHYALIAATLVAGPALAQTAAKSAMATKMMVTHTAKTTTKVAAAPRANTATHTTKSGKTITYDCSKKGNLNKKVCKK